MQVKRRRKNRRSPKNPELAEAGKKLTMIRAKKGLQLIEVAEKLDMSVSFLSDVENGQKVPGDLTIRKMAHIYGVDERILFKLYNKIPMGIIEEIEENPDLERVLSEIRYSRQLSNEQKQKLYKKMQQLYEEAIAGNLV